MKNTLRNGKWSHYLGTLSEHFVFIYLLNKGFKPVLCGKDNEQDDIIFRNEYDILTSVQVKSAIPRDHRTSARAAKSLKNGKTYRLTDFQFGLSKGSHWRNSGRGQSGGKATKSNSDIHFFVCNNLKTGDVNILNSKDMGIDIQKHSKHSLCINSSELNHSNFFINFDFTEALDIYSGNEIKEYESLLFEIPLITVKSKQIEVQ